MRQRVAGCVAGIVAVLLWEALTATSHRGLHVKPAQGAVDPLVALSEGVLAQTSDVRVLVQPPQSSLPTPPARRASASNRDVLEATPSQVAAAPCACPSAVSARLHAQDAGVPSQPAYASCSGTEPG